MRKPLRLVELEDIISSQIVGDDPEIISTVLNTHLALEAIVIEALDLLQAGENKFHRSFPQKSQWLVDQGVISHGDKVAFDRFNDFRNDLAHTFGHQVTLAKVLTLARELEAAGIDFSDSVGEYDEAKAADYYDGVIGVLAEVGWCVLFHAADLLKTAGGRNIFSAQDSCNPGTRNPANLGTQY
jgi:uncharacterized protein YutE (UPF0331/DUF86 family)